MWTLDTQQYLEQWRSRYAQDLTTDILPFWLKHGWDQEHGGVYTCVDRDGNLMDTTKSVWFQGRCGFIFAYAYNNIEKSRSISISPKAASTLSRLIVSTPTAECTLR